MTNWLDIETLKPILGKSYLLYNPTIGVYSATWIEDSMEMDSFEEWENIWIHEDAYEHEQNPTHWQPLPSPPKN